MLYCVAVMGRHEACPYNREKGAVLARKTEVIQRERY